MLTLLPRLRFLLLLAACLTAACGSVVRHATTQFSDSLTMAVLDQDDPTLVRDGLPGYLLLIDSRITANPTDADTLLAGAKLYGAYAGSFVEDAVRAQTLSHRAYGYARRALCLREKPLCDTLDSPYEKFADALKRADAKDIATLYGFAAAWAGRIQTHTGDWNAIADLPKLQALLERCDAIDPHFDGGGAALYLGVVDSIRPASLGGKPEEGRKWFERALELSGGKNQMVRVLYAQFYARLVFDQSLHDKLLNEVLAANTDAPGLTLINTLAKQKAKALLASGKDFF
ncbi:MAG: hypothetical protein JSR65_06150 [Proteobacteria bacterium]|nr:hypothetical protein [Pseudomonadota bacterium]